MMSGASAGKGTTAGLAAESSGTWQPRSDIQVVVIGNKADAESIRFRKMLQLWEEDPVMRADVDQQSLTAWKDIPVACGFRVRKPRENGVQRWATRADKLAQQQQYAKCLMWALECGLTCTEFQSNLDAVPEDFNQRGGIQIPLTRRVCW